MIRPTARLVGLAAGAGVAALAVAFASTLWPIWVVALALVTLGALLDWTLCVPAARLGAAIEMPSLAELGRPSAIRVTVARMPRGARVVFYPDMEGNAEYAPLTVRADGKTHSWEIAWTASRRGDITLHGVWLGWTGPLGLLESLEFIPHEVAASVGPNISAVQSAALRLSTHHTFLTGVKTRRMLGDGSEFEALRQYLPGLDHRMIDWKASAKHRKLLWREHRSERNHRVILAFDTGRLMAEPIDGMPRLDHGINAGMLLAYLALRSGDQVGLLGFDSEVRQFVAPVRGVQALTPLMRAASSLEYSFREANYTLAVTDLNRRLPRRSVIVVITDFVDPISALLMVENLSALARRHLVVFVSLRDPSLSDLVARAPVTALDIHRTVVAHELIQDRDQVLNTLRRRGIHCIDAPPEGVTVDLLNKYLDIQRRELL